MRIAVILCFLFFVACSHDPQRVRDGLMTTGIRQSAFLEEWGKPDRTYVTTGQELITAGVSGNRGSFFKGRERLEVWVYEQRKTELVFSKRRLVSWTTP